MLILYAMGANRRGDHWSPDIVVLCISYLTFSMIITLVILRAVNDRPYGWAFPASNGVSRHFA